MSDVVPLHPKLGARTFSRARIAVAGEAHHLRRESPVRDRAQVAFACGSFDRAEGDQRSCATCVRDVEPGVGRGPASSHGSSEGPPSSRTGCCQPGRSRHGSGDPVRCGCPPGNLARRSRSPARDDTAAIHSRSHKITARGHTDTNGLVSAEIGFGLLSRRRRSWAGARCSRTCSGGLRSSP